MDGRVNHTGGLMYNNLAASNPIAEITESG